MKIKKFACTAMAVMLLGSSLAGCGSNSAKDNTESKAGAAFDTSKAISVITREEGSGTRGAFVELFGVEEKDSNGKKIDKTTTEATVTNNTSVMMTSVAGNNYSIGYISLGSLNDTVKALKIDGAEATVENIKNSTYKISRPFNIATKEGLSEVAQDFVNYIMSTDGQKVISDSGYISTDAKAYTSTKAKGKIVIAGSSSVTPVMEKLKEAYLKVNTNAQIEIQESDSTTGMTSAKDGLCDIGMASRELKESELSAGLKSTTIATDGIAVIVNKNSTISDISSADVKSIFTGAITKWSEVK